MTFVLSLFVPHLVYVGCASFQRVLLVLLNPDIPCFANSADSDQLASGSALFAIKYANI